MTEYALDALLAEYVAPPVPDGLVARVAAAALALPQEPRRRSARRAAALPRHNRRRLWLRRPLLAGGVAVGLAVSGAVAATLAGVRVDWPAIEALLEDLPFFRGEAPREATPRARPPAVPLPASAPPPAAEPAPAGKGAAARLPEAAPSPRAPIARDEAPPAAPDPLPTRSDMAEPRRIETRPPVQPLGPAIEATRSAPPPRAAAEREAAPPAPAVEIRPSATAVDDLRRRQERLERAERLRAARQAQMERMQRVQQRRERLQRPRRN
jgi:hypothetical protein